MSEQAGQWHFLTDHARVLFAISRDPATRLRDIAAVCRITERTALSIVTDLEQAGYMRREREGRRAATSSAWTAPSVIQQRQTRPSGN
ncbi:winged helix-turn-helix domain-containing protein [Streptomyces sp. NPDC102270]|uniref:winged helix-turn-helix domain-containing protein n=1 Tax=Streptomyces sp. NPDC102270 TaxID=3366150 RepID=UPI0038296728